MFDASNNGFFLMNLNLFTKKIIAKKKRIKKNFEGYQCNAYL